MPPAFTAPLLVDPSDCSWIWPGSMRYRTLLRMVVDRLTESPRVALARIWMVQRSEDCTGCLMAAECWDRSDCLHLVASNGRSAVDPLVEWTRLDGAFHRLPIGVRKVGLIAATGEPIEVPRPVPGPARLGCEPGLGAGRGLPMAHVFQDGQQDLPPRVGTACAVTLGISSPVFKGRSAGACTVQTPSHWRRQNGCSG